MPIECISRLLLHICVLNLFGWSSGSIFDNYCKVCCRGLSKGKPLTLWDERDLGGVGGMEVYGIPI